VFTLIISAVAKADIKSHEQNLKYPMVV